MHNVKEMHLGETEKSLRQPGNTAPSGSLAVKMSKLSAAQLAALFVAVVAHAAVLGWSQYSPRENPARPAEPMTVTVSLFAPVSPASRAAPSVSQPPVEKPAPAATQELAVIADDPFPSVAPATVAATEAAPTLRPQEQAITPARGDAAYLRNPAPSYPLLSRRLGERGRVLLSVLVQADGSAMSVKIETGSGYARLDQAARETVSQWHFIPAMQGNQAVNSWVIIPIDFSLKG